MIVELFIKLISTFVLFIYSLLPNIPVFPQTLLNSVNKVFDIIFSNLTLLPMFIRIDTIKTLVPLLIVVVNFEYIYNFVMWLLRKIPGFSIS